jgi:DNA sulfur modification protein DndD
MLLRELILHDFRTFGGRQTIQLSSKRKNRPIILVGGLNGAGKTTILDALQLALYGKRARCASRGNMGYKTYLRQAINRRASAEEGASVELAFTHSSDGVEREYRVRRSWTATDSTLRERVEVQVDGADDSVLTEQWDERVDDFLPHRISQLFFFDGEKIAELAEAESSADVLKTAIHSLLGLELVDRLGKDLGILNSKKRREQTAPEDRAKSDHLRESWDRLLNEKQEATNRRGTLDGKLHSAKKVLDALNEKYMREGGELADQRTTFEGEKKTLEAELQDRREKLREITLGSLPLAVISGLLASVDELGHSEEEQQQHVLLAGVLENRDTAVLKKLKKNGASKAVLKELDNLLKEDRTSRSKDLSTPAFLDLAPEEVRQLDRLVKSEVPAQRAGAADLCKELDRIQERLVTVERRLRSIPEEGELIDLRSKRAAAQMEVEQLGVSFRVQDDLAEFLTPKIQQAKDSLDREIEKGVAANWSNQSLQRSLERMDLATVVLDEFRRRILKKNLGRVESSILESFQYLIRKPNLITRLEIDPVEFTLNLIGEAGRTLKHEDLSAGEKQLLAISMLWGLARTAGLPLPVVVDTPLGRLDSKHRTHLVERYFPQASHQVLLLSTDEEIKDNRLTDLEPFVGRSYLLEYIEEDDRTLVTEGYFDN